MYETTHDNTAETIVPQRAVDAALSDSELAASGLANGKEKKPIQNLDAVRARAQEAVERLKKSF